MQTRERFVRGPAIRCEQRTLAAGTYNLLKILQVRARPDALFVPIRSMLFLAVADDEEVVFLDGATSRCRIELAWRQFRPQGRENLDAPIPYHLIHYTEASLTVMQRLQSEFHRALLQLRDKAKTAGPATVIPLRR